MTVFLKHYLLNNKSLLVSGFQQNILTNNELPCLFTILQGILKRSLPPSCDRIALADRKEKDGVVGLFKAIGKMHCCGVNFNLDALCQLQSSNPSRDWFGNHVDWDHTDSWFIPKPEQFMTSSTGGKSLNDVVKIGML